MAWKKEYKYLLWMAGGFLAFFYLPVGWPRFDNAVTEGLQLTKWYAREHVLLCLIPAFFIAGAISVFVSQESVLRYLGHKAKRVLAYGVASVSGTILAVCSCTVLPLFAGIYSKGAGIGPATAFLYSGPAINVLAIILTARILGIEMGLARAFGAIIFSVIIGLLMHLFFRKEEARRQENDGFVQSEEIHGGRPLWQTGIYFGLMVGILIFANWAPGGNVAFWNAVFSAKWYITGALLLGLALVLWKWFTKDELVLWKDSTWVFAKQIFPLLLGGVLVAGFLLGRPGQQALIPNDWVARLVGGNSLGANFFAAIAGAFMYFATLTEVPILQGLMGSGMGKGPALALLLAGPALSLPSMLVIRSIMGTKKTLVYIALVVIMSMVTGMLYGWLF